MSYPPPSIDTPPTVETYESIREWLNEDDCDLNAPRAAYWHRWQDTLRTLRNELHPDRLERISEQAKRFINS